MKWFYNHLKSNVKDRDIIAPHIDNPNAVCDECTFVYFAFPIICTV